MNTTPSRPSRRRTKYVWIVRRNGELAAAFSSEVSADTFAFESNSRDRIAQAEAANKGILYVRQYFTWEKLEVRDQ